MKIDNYTKVVLTAISLTLLVLCIKWITPVRTVQRERHPKRGTTYSIRQG